MTREAGAPHLESSPHLPQLEEIPHSNKDLAQSKVNLIVLKKKGVSSHGEGSGQEFMIMAHGGYDQLMDSLLTSWW